MTNEKALEMFRAGIEATECEVKKDLYQTAISALEKQIPKKVIAHQHCPCCARDVIGSGFYCWNCGQRLDWSD